ncbi:MAG: 4Fe-4S ferredoxin [Deltaproteobacteria bacterium HGW-Deltaproteobacteria-3]|nr:MAG: 4Fe-4S ferredoxin [Deltaproteobacteria bacterium HGW-Deltaproteobacteria-3]
MKILRKIIEIDENLCTGCGECIINCAEGALQIVDGKARMLAEKYCDGLGACLGHCPTGALRIIEREAEDFDEEAVEELLKNRNAPQAHPAPPVGGCPSARLQTFAPATPCQAANAPVQLAAASGSALSHWPVQIRLVPPSAPFLKDADLLIAADCVPVAYPDFHRNLLSGKVVMVGCPKFDEIAKFAEIFASSGIKSITMAIMEVPCCSNMRHIVSQALSRSGTAIPVREVVISARGELLRQGEMPS